MLQAIDRYMKQAIVDKVPSVSSSALVSSLVSGEVGLYFSGCVAYGRGLREVSWFIGSLALPAFWLLHLSSHHFFSFSVLSPHTQNFASVQFPCPLPQATSLFSSPFLSTAFPQLSVQSYPSQHSIAHSSCVHLNLEY